MDHSRHRRNALSDMMDEQGGLLRERLGGPLKEMNEQADPLRSRYKMQIEKGANFDFNRNDESLPDKVQKKLKDEGDAPALMEVDAPEKMSGGDEHPDTLKEANKFPEMYINSEDRNVRNKFERGEEPSGFGERMQMEAYGQENDGDVVQTDEDALEYLMEKRDSLQMSLDNIPSLSEAERKLIQSAINEIDVLLQREMGDEVEAEAVPIR